MKNSCSLCASACIYLAHTDSNPTESVLDELFHQPCSSCTATSTQEDLMCDICRHLRLRHISRCVTYETRRKFQFLLRNKLIGTLATPKCPLCRLVTDMLKAGLGTEQLAQLTGADDEIFLYLGHPRHSESPGADGPSADLYANYPHGGGILNVWIGDLRIDDVQDPVLPLVEGVISWPSLKEKMDECFETHETCRRDSESSLPKGFRVIDVIERRIVELSDCSFVALSYVWGADQRLSLLTALRDTIEDMRKEGGLPVSRMPQTIEDAISVCTQLGHRYLWADRLCIIQDDAEDKGNQIEAMGAIYLLADLVLIAAHGDSMDHGIPGVSQRRNQVQRAEEIDGLRITSLVRETEDDPLSVWETRGWTYQEAVLSRRRLYFTNSRVFFECEQAVFHEDRYNLETIRDEFITIRLTVPEDVSQFGSFMRHLKHYTSRKLTYRSDVYNALRGISKSLYGDGSALVYGLPQKDFDHALLWYSDFGEKFVKRYEFQGGVLPSWSWSSNAGLSDQVQYQGTEFYGTFVSWYSAEDASTADTTKSLNISSNTSVDEDWQLYMAIACGEGCVESVSLPFSCAIDNFKDVRERFSSRWGDYLEFNKQAILPSSLKSIELQLKGDGSNAHCAKPGVIATKCKKTSLRLMPKSGSYGVEIVNLESEQIGELCGDAAALREEIISSHDTDTAFEFIALSLSGRKIFPSLMEKLGPKNYYDVDGNALPKVPVVNVLMIGREGGYAHRRALGWIFLIDWAKLESEWTSVLLQ